MYNNSLDPATKNINIYFLKDQISDPETQHREKQTSSNKQKHNMIFNLQEIFIVVVKTKI